MPIATTRNYFTYETTKRETERIVSISPKKRRGRSCLLVPQTTLVSLQQRVLGHRFDLRRRLQPRVGLDRRLIDEAHRVGVEDAAWRTLWVRMHRPCLFGAVDCCCCHPPSLHRPQMSVYVCQRPPTSTDIRQNPPMFHDVVCPHPPSSPIVRRCLQSLFSAFYRRSVEHGVQKFQTAESYSTDPRRL